MFYIVFRGNNAWHYMWIVCLADDSHVMSSIIFSEKIRNKNRLLSALEFSLALQELMCCLPELSISGLWLFWYSDTSHLKTKKKKKFFYLGFILCEGINLDVEFYMYVLYSQFSKYQSKQQFWNNDNNSQTYWGFPFLRLLEGLWFHRFIFFLA